MEIIWVNTDADAIYLFITTSYIKSLRLDMIYQLCIKQLYLAANNNKLLPVEPSREILRKLEEIYTQKKDEIYRVFDLLHYVRGNMAPFVSTNRYVTVKPDGHSAHTHEVNIDIQTDLLDCVKAVSPFVVSLYVYEGLVKKLNEFVLKYNGKSIATSVKSALEKIESNNTCKNKAEAKHWLVEELLLIICNKKSVKSDSLFQKQDSAIAELAHLIDQASIFFSRISTASSETVNHLCKEFRVDESKIEVVKKLSQQRSISTLYGQPEETEVIYKKINEEEQKRPFFLAKTSTLKPD